MRYLFVALITVIIYLLPAGSFAQQKTFTLRFIDRNSNLPLQNVSLYADGIEIAHSDSTGHIVLSPDQANHKYLIAFNKEYIPDTIRANEDQTVILYPLSVSLKETIVKSNSAVKQVLKSAREYVVDYDFVGDNILVASYSNDIGTNAKLFLLSPDGDTLAVRKLNAQPMELFKSCTGNYYCIFKDRFYLLNIYADAINIDHGWNLDLLPAIRQCQQCNNGIEYFRIEEPYNKFHAIYGWNKIGDTLFHPFMDLNRKDTKSARDEEMVMAMRALKSGDFNTAAYILRVRQMFDKGPLKGLTASLFLYNNDSLLLFDLHKRKIHIFDQYGNTDNNHPILFPYTDVLFFDIIKDDVTGRFYLYKHHNQQVLQELDISTGTLNAQTAKPQHPFVENLKVHNGNLYYLWQDGENGGTRQLFVQTAVLPGYIAHD
jgi:hypothetical protein